MTNIPAGDTPARAALRRRQHLALGAVFLLAIVLRFVFLWGQAEHNPLFDYPSMDNRYHHVWATQIANGEGMGPQPYFRAPLYYYVLGLVYKVTGPDVLAGRLANCVLGALTCYLLAHLGVMLAGFRAGLLAGVLAAVYWPFIYFDGELLTVCLELVLDVALLLLLVRAGRGGSRWWYVAAGVAWGLSAITRPNILAFAPAIALWVLIAAPADRRIAAAARSFLLTCAGAAVAILPVTVRNYVVGHELVLVATNGGVNFYIGNNPKSDGCSAVVPGTRKGWQGGYEDTHRIAELDRKRKLSESEVSDYWYAKAVEWITSNPAAWTKLLARKALLFWTTVEMPNNAAIWPAVRLSGISVLFRVGFGVVACLGIAGMVLLRDQWRTWFLPAAFLVIYMATVVAFFCNARYRLPVVPVLILFGAAGVARFIDLVRSRPVRTTTVYLGAMAVAGVLLVIDTPNLQRFRTINESKWERTLGYHYATPPPAGPGDWAKAAQHLSEAVKLTPWHAESRLGLGRALARLGRLDEAERQFAAAVERNPSHADARFQYATVLSQLGRTDEAIEQLRATVALQPSYARAHQELGCILGGMGRTDEARQHLRAALAIQPDLARARACLSRLER